MKTSTIATLGSLLGLSMAMPTAQDSNNTLVARGTGDRCGDSIFIDRTSGASPTIFDCAALVYRLRINTPDAYWSFILNPTDEDPNRWLIYGTCVFGVRRAYHGPQRPEVLIGANDMADLIDNSIQKFGRDDKVGAEGAMVCEAPNNPQGEGVWWGIWHS